MVWPVSPLICRQIVSKLTFRPAARSSSQVRLLAEPRRYSYPADRTVWDQLAESLKNKLNVASVNCDEHPAFCRREKVQGYPTIRLYV